MFEFVEPRWFWLLLLLIPYLLVEVLIRDRKRLTLLHSQVDLIREIAGRSSWQRFIPLAIKVVVIILMISALARPRLAYKQQEITGKGIDIMLALDVSGSMKAVDFQPVNRLEAAKKVALDFIQKRHNDRIGLIVFSENAFTQCPLTLDYNILMSIMQSIEIDEKANGTAIGMGLATAVARLKESEAKSKVIILITDGRNNTGEIDPFTAADIAATFGVKVYAIGVGSRDEVDFPVQTAFGIQYRKVKIEMDMDTLNRIAEITGTERARLAQNTAELSAIIQYIDKLETTELKIRNYYEYQEIFPYLLTLALFLILLILFYKVVIFRELP